MSRLKAGLACLLALSVAVSASATTAARFSNEGLTGSAELILLGRAEASRSVWIDRQLVTLVTVSVSETLKGVAGPTVTVALPGGVDLQRRFPVAVTWPGAPTLSSQEEVFLFLVPADEVPGAHVVVGFSQGKFSIVEENGVKSVSRDLSRVDLVGPRGTARGTRTSAPLTRFKQEIRSYIRDRS